MAPGTAHFRTSIDDGRTLMRALHGRYSGLCQPTYVLDIPGGYGKSPIGPNYLTADGTAIEDFNGCMHRYPPQPDAVSAGSVQQSTGATANARRAEVQAATEKKTSVSNA
jgi:lysine 2,3-aminomutase